MGSIAFVAGLRYTVYLLYMACLDRLSMTLRESMWFMHVMLCGQYNIGTVLWIRKNLSIDKQVLAIKTSDDIIKWCTFVLHLTEVLGYIFLYRN